MLILDTDIASAFSKSGHFDVLIKLKERLSKIGKGEIESIIVCLKRGYLFSSFDNRAVSKAKELGVEVIVAGVIFKGLIDSKGYRNEGRGSKNCQRY